MSATSFKELKYHIGHDVELVRYGKEKEICLECNDCNEVLKTWTPEDFISIHRCPECIHYIQQCTEGKACKVEKCLYERR